jgi:nucleotide-binding universal stress UspA family protein
MKQLHKPEVVVGVDGSPESTAAMEYAADLAQRRRERLAVVHAIRHSAYPPMPIGTLHPVSLGRPTARELLDNAVTKVSRQWPDLHVRGRLADSPPGVTLVRESRRADTVVVGRRGSGGFPGMVLGSTTLQLATQARCPVIVVPLPGQEAPRHGVVVGVDGSAISEAAIEYAFRAASETREPLTAVHAWTSPARSEPHGMVPLVYDPALVTREEELVLAESLAGWSEKYPEVEVTSRVVHAHPVTTLVKLATSARLLVVGSHGSHLLRLGSVSHRVLHHAASPVAIVRPTEPNEQ